ncbi:hypothetical protein TcCL_NonESM12377 [Trypanosoma cruzi]|nr:hypothetical protein TcCL_NonESM12377 [Trypanosoma cruzi]
MPHKIKFSHVEDRSENEHNDEQHEGCLCCVSSQHSILRWLRPLPHKRHRCNITYTQQSEIRKNIAIFIQDATTTSTVSSRWDHILQNMIHAYRKFVVQLHK